MRNNYFLGVLSYSLMMLLLGDYLSCTRIMHSSHENFGILLIFVRAMSLIVLVYPSPHANMEERVCSQLLISSCTGIKAVMDRVTV